MRTIWDFYDGDNTPLASCVINLPDDLKQLKIIINLPALMEKHKHTWQCVWPSEELPGYRWTGCSMETADVPDLKNGDNLQLPDATYTELEHEAATQLHLPGMFQPNIWTDPEGFEKVIQLSMVKVAEVMQAWADKINQSLKELHNATEDQPTGSSGKE